MSKVEFSRVRIFPPSAEECQLIRTELAEVLKTPHFANSKRYPAFLQYAVERAIEGQHADLKERTLGIEVFQRKPDYDTNSDTVVRFAASEVRKRLALVYHESSFQHTIQITLPTGSYIPEFFHVTPAEPDSTTIARTNIVEAPGSSRKAEDAQPSPKETTPPPRRRRPRWFAAAAGIALLFAIGSMTVFSLHGHTAVKVTSADRFWDPLRSAPGPVLLTTGASVFSSTAAGAEQAEKTDEYPYVSMVDAKALVDLAKVFSKIDVDFILKPSSATTLADMREHPVVLLGAYNNQWTVRLLSDARFRFADRPMLQIYDATDSSKTWERPAGVPYKDADDFAIVARFHNKLTDTMVFVIAGIGKNGTEAAAQFVMTPRYLDLLNHQSKDWASRNVEVVLKTRVVDGKAGAPSIEALDVW